MPLNEEELIRQVEASKKAGRLRAFYELLPEITFESFWTAYPKKEKKVMAERTWHKMTESDKLKAVRYLSIFLRKKEKSKEFVPLPTTYLNQRIFDDITQ